MFFIISIDVEADNEWGEPGRKGLKLGNIEQLGRFNSLCAKFNIRPSYLLSYPVAASDSSAAFFRGVHKNGGCEIGSHLHSWSTPPLSAMQIKNASFQSDLSLREVREKIQILTATIVSRIGIKPVSFRAGRWGMDGRSLRILEENGYKVDSSVTPSYSWLDIGGPTFVAAKLDPYYPDYYNLCRPGKSTILEVPVSIKFRPEIPTLFKKIYFRSPNIVRTALKKLGIVYPVWLEPTFTDLKDLISLTRRLKAKGFKVLHMMLHSSSLLAGGSPMSATSEKTEDIFLNLEKFFAFIKDNSHMSVTFSQLFNNLSVDE